MIKNGEDDDFPHYCYCLVGGFSKNQSGATPLFAACNNGHLNIVGMLLDTGRAKINVRVMDSTPLAVACRTRRPNVVKLLLKRGADVNLCFPLIHAIDIPTPDTPEKFEIINALLGTKEISKEQFLRSLAIIAQFGSANVMKLLLQKANNVDVATEKEKDGSSTIMHLIRLARNNLGDNTVPVIVVPILVAILCGHHSRCGVNSPFFLIAHESIIDIAKYVFSIYCTRKKT